MAWSSDDMPALQALGHRYALAATGCDADAWVGLFSADGVWERRHPAAGTKYDQQVRIVGRDNLLRFAAEHLKPAAREVYVVTNCVMAGDGAAAQGCRSVIVHDLAISPAGVFLVVDFVDAFVRQADGWRIVQHSAAPIGR